MDEDMIGGGSGPGAGGDDPSSKNNNNLTVNSSNLPIIPPGPAQGAPHPYGDSMGR